MSPTEPWPPPEKGGLETCATTARRADAGPATHAGRTATEEVARGVLGLRREEEREGDAGETSIALAGGRWPWERKTTVGRFTKIYAVSATWRRFSPFFRRSRPRARVMFRH